MACPICSRPADKAYSPFCSQRCADVDLSRWLKGGYAIPGSQGGEDDEDGLPDLNSPENNVVRDRSKGMDRE